MTPPNKIQVVSDGNVLELKSNSKGVIVYEYVVSESKLGELLTLSKEQFDKGFRMDIFKEKTI